MSKRTGTMMVVLAGLLLSAAPQVQRRPAAARPTMVEAVGQCTTEAPAAPAHHRQPWEEGCGDSPTLAPK
jgi:hypothetical protein